MGRAFPLVMLMFSAPTASANLSVLRIIFFLAARKAGKVRYIGFTGHKDPAIHLKMLNTGFKHGFTFDTVQMPLNVLDPHYHSFAKEVVPVCLKHGIAVLGMANLPLALQERAKFVLEARVPIDEALRDAALDAQLPWPERYEVPAHAILQRVGEAGYVGGQEDMIEDVALDLARERESVGAGGAA